MSSPWGANLKALGERRDPGSVELARLLAAAGPAPDAGLRARDGSTVPTVGGETPRALVSTFDAGREAERWSQGASATVAVLGAGGREAAEALFVAGCTLVFWVEPRLDVWRSLWTTQDWTTVCRRPGWVPVPGSPDQWEAVLNDTYHPLWDGGFETREWRAAGLGEAVADFQGAARRALSSVAADASTQARFAARWYRNMLVNLSRLTPASLSPCTGARVVVAGAGPTLEDALALTPNRDWLEARAATGDRLFAADTALPALTARGVVPDAVFCLDGQLASYHHFVPAGPPVPLVADLAALPLANRLARPVVRFLSGHPFGRVVRRHFPELPLLDASLGNVAGVAARAALALGASHVDTWGVDFAYRDGQTYARGTYGYELASRRADRLIPMETRLSAGCYGATGRERTRDALGRAIDTTPLLRDYRERWSTSGRPPAVVAAHGEAGTRWQDFAADWGRRLETLPLPPEGTRMAAFVAGLPTDRREDWLALWPLALALNRVHPGPDLPQRTRDAARQTLVLTASQVQGILAP